jgi:hypothetical protein
MEFYGKWKRDFAECLKYEYAVNFLVCRNMNGEFLVLFNMHSHMWTSVISSSSSGTTLCLPVHLQWNIGTPYLHCLLINETFSLFENSVLGHDAAWRGNQIPVFWWNIMSFSSRVELSVVEHFDSWRWRYCVAFKCRDLFTWWGSFMPQKNGIVQAWDKFLWMVILIISVHTFALLVISQLCVAPGWCNVIRQCHVTLEASRSWWRNWFHLGTLVVAWFLFCSDLHVDNTHSVCHS